MNDADPILCMRSTVRQFDAGVVLVDALVFAAELAADVAADVAVAFAAE